MKKSSEKSKQEFTFLPVKPGLDCVFFVKTRKPVDPVDFVLRFCQDAEGYSDPKERPLRHINKLSPVVAIGSSLDVGLEKTARRTLGEVFQLKPEKGQEESQSPNQDEDRESTTAYSVRPLLCPLTG
jgi:tRNA acetyltransferase TAN1